MENPDSIIKKLIAVSKVDASLANIAAEVARVERDFKAKQASLAKAVLDRDVRVKNLADKRYKYQREEHAIRDERAKLTSRRDALATLNSHKLIEAAEREIDAATRLLDTRDEELLKVLDDLDRSETDTKRAEELAKREDEELQTQKVDAEAAMVNLKQRRTERSADREAAIKGIDATSLQTYERIRVKFAADAIVPVKNSSCSACHMQVMPQMVLQISQGQSLVKCRGCGRILYLEEGQTSAA